MSWKLCRRIITVYRCCELTRCKCDWGRRHRVRLKRTGAQPRLKSWGGPRFVSQHAPGQKPGWVLSAGGDRLLPLWGFCYQPRNFVWKVRCWILHSGDYLLWNFLLFKNYGQEVGGQYIVGPQKLGTSLPQSLRLLRILKRWKVKARLFSYVKCEKQRPELIVKIGFLNKINDFVIVDI